MKKSIKAALYSGLVFPGVGHFSLTHYARGLALFIPTLAAAAYVGNDVWQKANAILDKAMRGDIPLDPEVIAGMVSAAQPGSDSLWLNIATWMMMGCWVVGVVDAYRLGVIEEKSDPQNSANFPPNNDSI